MGDRYSYICCVEHELTDTGSTTLASSNMKREGRDKEMEGSEGGGGGVVYGERLSRYRVVEIVPAQLPIQVAVHTPFAPSVLSPRKKR